MRHKVVVTWVVSVVQALALPLHKSRQGMQLSLLEAIKSSRDNPYLFIW